MTTFLVTLSLTLTAGNTIAILTLGKASKLNSKSIGKIAEHLTPQTKGK